MDRGRRASMFGSGRRGKLGSVPEASAASKFGGDMVAPKMQLDDNSLIIDPNLLVGPLYVPTTTRTDRIKEQLGDITSKLHKTLYDFDEFADFDHGEDPVVEMMKNRIHNIDDSEMRSDLNQFMSQYQDMSQQVSTANKDRDEMLMQLADWFTTDHVDLDDIKSSLDDAEEESMKTSYFETVTNFEKLKNLQSMIASASKQGKPTHGLEKAKLALENDVVDKFRVMKDMSMQTMKLKVADDAPWRYAANEIVSMLQNVRGENTAELNLITKKMQDMVDQLEKQAMTIKSLTAELREKKEVVKRLTDENSDLTQDASIFRARYTRYEKDLETAKQMIRSLHMEKLENGGASTEPVSGRLTESLSKALAQFDQEPAVVKEMSSDPALLRTKLREYQEALECIRGEYSRAAEDNEDLNAEIAEKKEYINSIEDENEKLLRDIKRLRQERRQSLAVAPGPAAGTGQEAVGHMCEHCKCHIPEKEFEEELEEARLEAEKWQEKCVYFKKCLADTEMKLSDAYKEISDLRMDRDPPASEQAPKAPAKQATSAPKRPKENVRKAPEEKKRESPTEPKESEGKAPNKPRPKPKTRARYLETKSRPDKSILPPIDKSFVDERMEKQLPAKLTPKQNREFKLYKAGDVQGKLNMLISEIMEFVTDIGKLLFIEKEEESSKVQSMKTYSFDQSNGSSKKQRDIKDVKDEEARQKKGSAILNGQQAVAKLREAYDLLSSSMNIQHDEYEAIYRSFKISQQRNAIRQAVLMGKMPVNAIHDFDRQQRQKMMEAGQDNLLSIYFNISYGGNMSNGMEVKSRRHRSRDHLPQSSSVYSLNSETEETESKLKNTMHVLSMQRSRSDLDTRDSSTLMASGLMMGNGLLRESKDNRSQIYVTNVPDQGRRESSLAVNKQEMKVGVAVVPRKGLISLATSEQADVMTGVSAQNERRKATPGQESHSAGKKSLFKNKAILEQIKMGNKLLEDAEVERRQKEEMSQSLGDYTIFDLQSKLLEMTDNKSSKRQGAFRLSDQESTEAVKKSVTKPDKSVTLPAIKNFNPFIVQ